MPEIESQWWQGHSVPIRYMGILVARNLKATSDQWWQWWLHCLGDLYCACCVLLWWISVHWTRSLPGSSRYLADFLVLTLHIIRPTVRAWLLFEGLPLVSCGTLGLSSPKTCGCFSENWNVVVIVFRKKICGFPCLSPQKDGVFPFSLPYSDKII